LSGVPKTKAKGHTKQAGAAGTSWNAKWHQVRPKHISKPHLLFSVFKYFITRRKQCQISKPSQGLTGRNEAMLLERGHPVETANYFFGSIFLKVWQPSSTASPWQYGTARCCCARCSQGAGQASKP